MLRYLAIATALVAVALGALLALPHWAAPAGDSRYISGRGTPGPAQRDERTYTAPPVTGDAPWALSALPECFHQVARASGSTAFVRARFPSGARRVPAGSKLVTADCTIDFAADSADVSRGDNALHVPAPARFYVTAKHLLLEREDGPRVELRTFALDREASPVVMPAGARIQPHP